MPPIRVLVVDDSVVIRKILTEALSSDPAIAVAATAADGHIAISKIPQVNPDLITLDIEMPGLSGFETLKEIRKQYPKLPVIMFSTLTERGAAATLEALALGASDYVMKPSDTGSLDVTMQRIREQLLPRVKALCVPMPREAFRAAPVILPKRPTPVVTPASGISSRIYLLAIGTSTGGPNALAAVLPALHADFPVPIVIVQHMPPLFTRLLAERLDKQSAIKIREGVPGRVLAPGEAWIAPGDYHMTVERHETSVQLAMNQEVPENSCRPAVDVLFRSVANAYGPGVLAVVLTGMGSDGVLGAQAVRERGGRVIVQDEASSVVWGMPGQVAAAGCAEGIYSLDEMAGEIERRVKSSGAGALRGGARKSEAGSERSRGGETSEAERAMKSRRVN